MASFDENSFSKSSSFSELAFDFGAAVITAVGDFIVFFRRRRR